jgi:hypothetical protein
LAANRHLPQTVPQPDMELFALTHRWTVSSYLWSAKSTIHFYTAWRDRPQYFIENFPKPDDTVKYAKPEDLDEFSEMLLSL